MVQGMGDKVRFLLPGCFPIGKELLPKRPVVRSEAGRGLGDGKFFAPDGDLHAADDGLIQGVERVVAVHRQVRREQLPGKVHAVGGELARLT